MVDAVQQYGYDYAFLLSAGALFGGGTVIFFGLIPKPTDMGLPEPEDLEDDDNGRPTPAPRGGIEVTLLVSMKTDMLPSFITRSTPFDLPLPSP